jgi:amino acid permease
LVVGVFVYYFVGLIVSRFGSLIIEPFLKKIKFLNFSDYKDFLKASAKDGKIEILSEENNMYRTFIATFLLLGLVKLYYFIANKWTFLNENSDWILILLIIGMFLFSYRKQTNYITKRINSQKASDE